ncbi:MAG TPA: hemolysin III family protein [Caulobacter sp.]|nr:hemolysin III family protein [Caulobacter sp.]
MTAQPFDHSDHYPSRAAREADKWVHIVGLILAIAGGGTLVGLSIGFGTVGQVFAVAVYGICLALMLSFSIAYNMSKPGTRPFLRRLDHAGIFLMIAGSYTPFTTQSLTGLWSIGMTTAVWALALAGVAGKLFLPGLGRGIWVALYLALGWIVLIAIGPMVAAVSLSGMILLAVGGVVYSLGVVFYVRKTLTYRRAIWHGFVLAGAGVQYAAIMTGVVLYYRA